MPQNDSRFDVFRLALPCLLLLLIAACGPTTQYQNTGLGSMPADWESRLAELEYRASNSESWPTDSEEAGEFVRELGQLIEALSPLAEANHFRRLAELRWTAIALEALHREPAESGGSASDETPYSLAIQLRAIADERPQRLDFDPEQSGSSLVQRLSDRANELEDRDISNRRVQALKFLRDRDPADRTKHQVVDDSIYELLDYLRYYESTRSDREDEEDDLSGIVEELENRIAAIEADARDKLRRDYQAWALEQIWAFEKEFEEIRSDEEWKLSKLLSWNEEEFTQLQNAVIDHLLPIDQTLLDLPVMKRYRSGFDEGWEVVEGQDGRKAQTCVAIASAIVAKRTFLDLDSHSPRPDRFEKSEEWKKRGCKR